jgi:hypothetical protein
MKKYELQLNQVINNRKSSHNKAKMLPEIKIKRDKETPTRLTSFETTAIFSQKQKLVDLEVYRQRSNP